MKVVLELQDQPSNVRRITVRHDIVIGRGSDCNLRLSAPQVSRRHCFLRVGRDSVSVTDLESSNGTFIDGTRISPGKRHDIGNGAQLALGPIRFIIHVRSDVALADNANSRTAAELLQEDASQDSKDIDPLQEENSTVEGRKQSPDSRAPMNYLLEEAGELAGSNEPTADFTDDQSSVSPSANMFAPGPDPADSRLEIVDFGRRLTEQSRDVDEVSAIHAWTSGSDEEPQWESSISDSSDSPDSPDGVDILSIDADSDPNSSFGNQLPRHVEASAADERGSAWLCDDEGSDDLLPGPIDVTDASVVQQMSGDPDEPGEVELIDDAIVFEEVLDESTCADVNSEMVVEVDEILNVDEVADGFGESDDDILEIADEVLEAEEESYWFVDDADDVNTGMGALENPARGEDTVHDDNIDPGLKNFLKGL